MHAVRNVDELREFIAGQVRAEMARQKIGDTELAEYLGQNQQWFSRRKLGAVAFDAAELMMVADYLGLPVTHFYGASDPSGGPGTPNGAPQGAVRTGARPEGLEPPTF